MAIKITEHAFEYGTVKYFRGKAENVEMGSFGEKKDPIGAKAHLDIHNKVKSEHLDSRTQFITTTRIDWNQTTRSEVEVNGLLKYFDLDSQLALDASYRQAKSAKLELAKFAIHEGPLTTMLNRDAHGARNYLADEGKDGRIVSEVWAVLSAELSEHFATSGTVVALVDGGDNKLKITATGGRHGTQIIKLAPGTTFAYLMHKVKKWNKGKTRIEDMEADYKGMG